MKHYLNKHTLLAAFAAMTCMAASAQEPVLEKRKMPETSLLTGKQMSGTGIDVEKITQDLPETGSYTLEVKARVANASGRGLDMQSVDGGGKGFRYSMNSTDVRQTNNVNAPQDITATDNTTDRLLRFAVKDGTVNFYQDGYYVSSTPLGMIKDYMAGEVKDVTTEIAGDAPLAGAMPEAAATLPTPASQGWLLVNDGASADMSVAGNVRFEQAPNSSFSGLKASDGSDFSGTMLVVRWDAKSGCKYLYPMRLQANTEYTLSMDAAYWNNGSNTGITVGVTQDATAENGFLETQDFKSTKKNFSNGSFTFTTGEAGTYYLVISSQSKGMYLIANPVISGGSGTESVKVIPDDFDTSAKPSPESLGWYICADNARKAWNTGSRFELSPTTQTLTNNDGTTHNGGFMFLRWDSDGAKNDYYVVPVQLEANSDYTLTMDVAYWDNYNAGKGGAEGGKGVRVGITRNAMAQEISESQFFSSNEMKKLYPGSFTFSTTEAGTYYLTMTGGWGLFAIADMKIQKTGTTAAEGLLFGNNEEGQTADMYIEYVKYDGTGAYAPDETTGTPSTVNIDNGGVKTVEMFFNSNVTISGKTDMHVQSETMPLPGNSTVNLNGEDAWLFFDNVKPSKFIAKYMDAVKVNGNAITYNQTDKSGNNVRIAIYGNGTVVIPGGEASNKAAITVYDGENFTGKSMTLDVETYHNNLGEWDNKIRSFKLKRGYMATLANNANGTGFSRVFIADEADLDVPSLPEGMENFVSFVRVFKWNWVSKKGKANISGFGDDNRLNVSCYYNWDVGGKADDPDVEYTPIRQNLGWPDFNAINAKKDVSHVLGYNEPNDKNQANCSVDDAIAQWPEMFKSGLRIGSPAPTSVWAWVGTFMNVADSLNYRVDFMAAHIYENSLNANSWKERVDHLSESGKGRPVWITEWNNGANWTNEWWPTASGPKRDADCNIILDENGNETTVTRPLSPENAEKQRKFIAELLPAMDKMEHLERYFEYDWVQDARALELNGKLTPAGKVYAEHKAALAYRKANAYDHVWKIAPPFPFLNVSDDYKTLRLNWYDHNGETGKCYVIERKLDDETEFTEYKRLNAVTDYEIGGNVVFEEDIPCRSNVTYRIKALSYKDTWSIYSREKSFTRDAQAAAPVLKGEALGTQVVKLSWDAVEGARSYRLERAASADGDWETVADYTEETEYVDEGLAENTTYYYRAYSLNNAAEVVASDVLQVKTLAMTVPSAIEGLHVSAGDKSVTLRWDFAYDKYYKVSRASDADGDYTVIAEKVDGTRFVDSDVVNGYTYYYKVQPWNREGEGPSTPAEKAQPVKGQYLHLSFDEQTGETAYDDWGGFDGTLCNGASTEEGRNGGGAVKMTRSQQSYVKVADGAVSKLREFTLASWVKFSGTLSRLFDFGENTGTFMMVKVGAKNMRYKLTCAKGTFDHTWEFADAVNTGEWVHLAFVQDDKQMIFYLNGEPVGTADNTEGVFPEDMGYTTRNYIARSQWSSDAYSDHVYDDFRIYNIALDADNVKRLYEDMPVVTSYTRKVEAGSWNTVCLPYAAVPAEGVTAYTVSGINAEKTLVSLAPVETMEAGVPYVFYSATDVAEFSETGEPADAPVAGDNGLTGVFGSEGSAVPAGSYVLDNGQWRMVKSDETFVLGGFMAYIPDLSTIGVVAVPSDKTIRVAANGTTGIDILTVDGGNEATYTLGGIKVDKVSQNDVYIRNGKKIAVGRKR